MGNVCQKSRPKILLKLLTDKKEQNIQDNLGIWIDGSFDLYERRVVSLTVFLSLDKWMSVSQCRDDPRVKEFVWRYERLVKPENPTVFRCY